MPPCDAYYIRSARARGTRPSEAQQDIGVDFALAAKKHVKKAEKVSMDGNAEAHRIETRRRIRLKQQLQSD